MTYMKFVFIHIQKSAGTSFWTMLRRHKTKDKQYKGINYLFAYPKHEKKWIKKMEKGVRKNYFRYNFIRGNFPYQSVLFLKKEHDWKLVTWIRDPIDRLISNYNHSVYRPTPHKEEKNLRQKSLEMVEKMDIVEYSKFMSNFTTRSTGHNPKIFDFIGVVEEHDKSIKRFNSQFKSRLPLGVKLNTNNWQPRVEVSQELREELRQDHLEDYEFYNKVIKRYK